MIFRGPSQPQPLCVCDFLFLYAILGTDTVILSIMWFAVTVEKSMKASEGILKDTKGRMVSSSNQCW